MPKTLVELPPDNEDIERASAFWYDDDDLFIEQIETGDRPERERRSLVCFGRKGIPALIAALQTFMEK